MNILGKERPKNEPQIIKKVLKRVIIKPSTMIIIQDHTELEDLRRNLMELFKIPPYDISFTFTERKRFICPDCFKTEKFEIVQSQTQIYKKCKCGFIFDLTNKIIP